AGLAILDSLRCYPTGNPEFPVVYYDLHNKMHLLHRSRVVPFVDSPDSEEELAGYGKCALSRAIAPVNREILMGRYVEQFLDDKPPPGVAVFRNITDEELKASIVRLDNEERTDAGSTWGKTIKLFGLQAENPVEVDFISYSKAPEKFDYEGYTLLNVRQIALAIGLDINDIWELSGSSLGTGTQSQIMAQKSRGKAFGRILKGLERVINRALPEDAEFVWQYKDPQEDIEEAQKAQTHAGTVNLMATDLTPDERRQYLANQIPALGDVLRDEDGTIRRLPDDDPKPEGEEVAVAADVESVKGTEKAFPDTASGFARTFTSYVRMAQRGDAYPGQLRAVMRDFLSDYGSRAYRDGLEEGGADPEDADSVELAQRRRKVTAWLASQDGFITKFVDELIGGGIEDGDIPRRADLWVSRSLRGIYYMGLADAAATVLKMWQLGQTEKHCDTCLTLNGQVHTVKEFIDTGLFPGSARLECGGFYCDCRLVDVPRGTRRQGTLPGSGSASVFDRLLGFFRGLTGGG
ncbi:MAG TPA: hypothetical protein VKN76_00395, partial [Kiloniellaceae bacterium]|nr:hypothetical protein [Kiloniellaceae bacterium]